MTSFEKETLITEAFSDPDHILDLAESHCSNTSEFFFVLDIRDRCEKYGTNAYITTFEKNHLETLSKRLWTGN